MHWFSWFLSQAWHNFFLDKQWSMRTVYIEALDIKHLTPNMWCRYNVCQQSLHVIYAPRSASLRPWNLSLCHCKKFPWKLMTLDFKSLKCDVDTMFLCNSCLNIASVQRRTCVLERKRCTRRRCWPWCCSSWWNRAPCPPCSCAQCCRHSPCTRDYWASCSTSSRGSSLNRYHQAGTWHTALLNLVHYSSIQSVLHGFILMWGSSQLQNKMFCTTKPKYAGNVEILLLYHLATLNKLQL